METIERTARGMRGRLNAGEVGGGAISLEYVLIAAFVIVVGALLMSQKDRFAEAFNSMGSYIVNLFNEVTV